MRPGKRPSLAKRHVNQASDDAVKQESHVAETIEGTQAGSRSDALCRAETWRLFSGKAAWSQCIALIRG
jgi:hypothetical protein